MSCSERVLSSSAATHAGGGFGSTAGGAAPVRRGLDEPSATPAATTAARTPAATILRSRRRSRPRLVRSVEVRDGDTLARRSRAKSFSCCSDIGAPLPRAERLREGLAPRVSRDFTVPTAQPSVSATSATGRSAR